jgi:hypothetical protein
MNVGVSAGVLGSAAGAPLSQKAGSEVERSQKDTAARVREVDSQNKSEKAAGIGTTEEDQQADERDADGRRLWEETGKKKDAGEGDEDEAERRVKDPTGMSGTSLDLTG